MLVLLVKDRVTVVSGVYVCAFVSGLVSYLDDLEVSELFRRRFGRLVSCLWV